MTRHRRPFRMDSEHDQARIELAARVPATLRVSIAVLIVLAIVVLIVVATIVGGGTLYTVASSLTAERDPVTGF